MDTRISEFEPIRIQRYVPELDLLSNPVLNAIEKEFLADYSCSAQHCGADVDRLRHARTDGDARAGVGCPFSDTR